MIRGAAMFKTFKTTSLHSCACHWIHPRLKLYFNIRLLLCGADVHAELLLLLLQTEFTVYLSSSCSDLRRFLPYHAEHSHLTASCSLQTLMHIHNVNINSSFVLVLLTK